MNELHLDELATSVLNPPHRGPYWLTLVFANSSSATMGPTLSLPGGESITKKKRGRPRKGEEDKYSKDWNEKARNFVRELIMVDFSKSWIKKVRGVLKEVPRIVKVKSPETFTRNNYLQYVEYLVKKYDNTDYRKQKLSALNKFLSRHENMVFTSVTYRWEPHVPAETVRLNDFEVGQIWTTSMSPIERMVFWSLSILAIRKTAILRLREQDINLESGWVYIRSKGGSGGKARKLKITPSGYEEIPRYGKYRKQVFANELKRNPDAKMPENWFIFWSRERPPRLRTLKNTKYDTMVKGLAYRSGIEFRGHVMRRTQARNLYNCGVKVEVIQKILGHDKLETTLHYIGIFEDEIAEGMVAGERYIDEEMEELYEDNERAKQIDYVWTTE